MKVTVRELRAVIQEVLNEGIHDKTRHMVDSIVETAENYVSSLTSGDRESGTAKILQQHVAEAEAYSKWLSSRNDPNAVAFAAFTKAAADLAGQSGFWKTPSFLGKTQHVEKMQQKLRRLQTLSVNLMGSEQKPTAVKQPVAKTPSLRRVG
jgi:hypothetical protein